LAPKFSFGPDLPSLCRELAQQIHQVTKTFTENLSSIQLCPLLLVGGTSVDTDLKAFRSEGGNIIIATPGRLDDVINRLGVEIKLKELEVLILDEADRYKGKASRSI